MNISRISLCTLFLVVVAASGTHAASDNGDVSNDVEGESPQDEALPPVEKKEVKIRKKKLKELFRRERRKAATNSDSPIGTINRDSEVFKKYLEGRSKKEEQEQAEQEEKKIVEGDFGKRTRRRHPQHNRPRNPQQQQHLPSRGATFYRGIPRGVTQATPTTTAHAHHQHHHPHRHVASSSASSLEAQLRELDEELQSHAHVDHVESNSLQGAFVEHDGHAEYLSAAYDTEAAHSSPAGVRVLQLPPPGYAAAAPLPPPHNPPPPHPHNPHPPQHPPPPPPHHLQLQHEHPRTHPAVLHHPLPAVPHPVSAPHHPAVEAKHAAEKEKKTKKAYNVKVAIEEVNGVLYRKTPPASSRPPPMVVHNHADPSFAHHEEAVVSDSIFRQAVGTTLRPFIKGTRVRFQHHPVEAEGQRQPPVSALPPAAHAAVPDVAEAAGEFYYKPVPEGSVPHRETYFKPVKEEPYFEPSHEITHGHHGPPPPPHSRHPPPPPPPAHAPASATSYHGHDFHKPHPPPPPPPRPSAYKPYPKPAPYRSRPPQSQASLLFGNIASMFGGGKPPPRPPKPQAVRFRGAPYQASKPVRFPRNRFKK